MKSLLNTRLVCVCVLFPLATHSYVFETFDAKVLLDQAPLVCKVKVLSVNRPWFFEKGGSLTARVKCLATIKGISPEEEFEVVSPASTHDGLNSVSYTELERGEVCIVFLHNMTRGMATFEDVHNGKMPGLGEFVPFKLEDTPQDRMLGELLALCKSSKGEIRLLATEYLGQLGDKRAKTLLEEISLAEDPVLRGVALTARIKCGDAPSQDQLLSFLNQDPAALHYKPSSFNDFSPPDWDIMRALEASIKVGDGYHELRKSRPSALLENFDYIAFYEKAMETKLMKAELVSHHAIAYALRLLADERSIPLLKKLLDDKDVLVRYDAVTALTRIHGHGPFPSVPVFKFGDTAYIGYWKEKLKQTGPPMESAGARLKRGRAD